MSKYLFFYKTKNVEDRDCVVYLEYETIDERFHYKHYFGRLNISGACFSQGFEYPVLSKIDTVLYPFYFDYLKKYNEKIEKLGYGIEKGSRRYCEGFMYYDLYLKPVYDKLLSKENEELFLKIQEEEKSFLENKLGLTRDEIEYIWDNYNLDYRDRSIVGSVYNDVNELGREEAENYIENFKIVQKYFDYEKFGKDLLESDNYLELDSGRIVSLNY